MSQEWGRAESAGNWPSRKPVWKLTAVLVALVVTLVLVRVRYESVSLPLQRHYLSAYVRSGMLSWLGLKSGSYRLLSVTERNGHSVVVLDDWLTPSGQGGFALLPGLAKLGISQPEWREYHGHKEIHMALGGLVYRDHYFRRLVLGPALIGLGVLIAGLFFAVPKDRARARLRRDGRRLKGPELVTVADFNRRNGADGIGFPSAPGALAKWASGEPDMLRVPRAVESSHFLLMGDSGSGKSTLVRRMLVQIAERGETAIVYDPAREYTPCFFRPERGDVILNPLDARMPYWDLGAEVRHEAEALTLATSLFPDQPNENPFFIQGPRKIFAHLLSRRPRHEDVTFWLTHQEQIDPLLEATPLEAMVEPKATGQRAGVLASLSMVADAFKRLPTEKETRERWSAAKWSEERRGWLFVTSTPETRDALRPLISLWLDTLVLRLMSDTRAGSRPVWFILDELASLQRLPQLHTAVTENRKSNNPVVLGFQGRSQLEVRYGHEAEVMLSQPATKVFLKTSEPRAAKWISDAIGEIEIERLRESRSSGQGLEKRSSTSFALERKVEPLVMASEISGLEVLCGYLKLGNLVVRMRFPFQDLPKMQPAFIPRPMGERPAAAPPAASPAAPPAEPSGETPFFE